MWRWANFLHSRVPAGKQPVFINIDETGIRLLADDAVGFLTRAARTAKRRPEGLHRVLPRSVQRSMFTHVAAICSEPEVQRVLPQILLFNKHTTSAAVAAELRARAPAHVVILVMENAWMNTATMVQLVNRFARALAPLRDRFQPILSWDTFRPHIATQVWAATARAGFFVHLVPCHMTGTLQPADTHLFAQYKRQLRQHVQSSAMDPATSGLPRLVRVACAVYRILRDILESKSWMKAFQDLGLAGSQELVSTRVKRKLGIDAVGMLPAGIPTLQELQLVFPARTTVPIDGVFRAVLRAQRPAASASSAVGVCAAAATFHGATAAASSASSSTDAALPHASRPWPPPPLPPPLSLPPRPRGVLRLGPAARLPPAPPQPRRLPPRPTPP